MTLKVQRRQRWQRQQRWQMRLRDPAPRAVPKVLLMVPYGDVSVYPGPVSRLRLHGGGCGHEFNFKTGAPLGAGSMGSPANERQWKFAAG